MKRKIKIFCQLFILMLLCLSISACKQDDAPAESFPKIVSELKSYKMVGKLETNFPSGTKESIITTYYKAPNLYRVEIQNPNANETQIMIRNEKGVFVLIPSINKTFKVNTTWPGNNSYPYLLQSLSNDIVSDENIEFSNNNNTLGIKAKLFNNKNLTQKITFNDANMPTEVIIYDSNENVIMKYLVTSLDTNLDIDDSNFVASETLETLFTYYQENPIDYERYVTYPTYYPEGTSLEAETISGTSTDRLAIMKFSGTYNYTIVQEFISDIESAKVEYVNGDVMVFGGVFNFINENHIEFYENGIEYTIASNDVEVLEMIKTLESLRTTDIK